MWNVLLDVDLNAPVAFGVGMQLSTGPWIAALLQGTLVLVQDIYCTLMPHRQYRQWPKVYETRQIFACRLVVLGLLDCKLNIKGRHDISRILALKPFIDAMQHSQCQPARACQLICHSGGLDSDPIPLVACILNHCMDSFKRTERIGKVVNHQFLLFAT